MEIVIKMFLKKFFGKLFNGLSWIVQGFIEYWKVWIIAGSVAYLILLHFQVRNLTYENKNLSNTVFKQDSTIVAVRSKYMVDSVNLTLRELSMQNTVAQVNAKNKDLERKSAEKDQLIMEKNQLIKDLAEGNKCQNIFGNFVKRKKKD